MPENAFYDLAKNEEDAIPTYSKKPVQFLSTDRAVFGKHGAKIFLPQTNILHQSPIIMSRIFHPIIKKRKPGGRDPVPAFRRNSPLFKLITKVKHKN